MLAGCLGTAYTETGGGDLAAAGGAAVCIADTAASDELGTVSGTDVLGAGVVGGDLGERDGGNFLLHVST